MPPRWTLALTTSSGTSRPFFSCRPGQQHWPKVAIFQLDHFIRGSPGLRFFEGQRSRFNRATIPQRKTLTARKKPGFPSFPSAATMSNASRQAVGLSDRVLICLASVSCAVCVLGTAACPLTKTNWDAALHTTLAANGDSRW